MCWREWKLCAPSLVLACLQCFQNDGSLSLRWWSNWQNHRWLRLAESVGVHLVHTSAQVGLPRASCPCPDGFWVTLRMETPQPPKQPVLLLSHSHSRRKSFLTLIQKFPFVPLPLDLPLVEGLGRTRQSLQVCSESPSARLYVLTCMQIKSPADAFYSWFPIQLPWNRLDLTVRPRYINWTSDQFFWLNLSVAFENLWKIRCVLPCRALAVLENGSGVLQAFVFFKFYSSSCLCKGKNPYELKWSSTLN